MFRDVKLEARRKQGPKWVFERYNKVVTTETFPDIAQSLATLYANVQAETKSMNDRIKVANQSKIEAAEEKLRQA